MNALLQNAIFDLFDSTEIINHLRSSQDRLRPSDYAEIIAGAPISLDKKVRLLKCLESTTKDETSKSVIGEYVRSAEHAVEALHAADRSRFIFHVSLNYFDLEDRCADHCDGPFPAVSLNKAKQAIAIYRAKNDTDLMTGRRCTGLSSYTTLPPNRHMTASYSLATYFSLPLTVRSNSSARLKPPNRIGFPHSAKPMRSVPVASILISPCHLPQATFCASTTARLLPVLHTVLSPKPEQTAARLNACTRATTGASALAR